jgi:hypothetical protein
LATTILYPNGDGTIPGLVGGTAGPPYYVNVDEGTDSPNDSDVILVTNSDTSFFLLLTDCPVDLGTVTACTIKVRTADSAKGRALTKAQIFQSNESTALTAEATWTGSTTNTTYTLNPALTGATDKSSWDGARLKLTTSSASGGSAALLAAQVNLTYTEGGGGGGGGQNRVFSFTLNLATSAIGKNSLVVPFNREV